MNVLYNLTKEKHFVKTINQWEFDYSLFTDLLRIAKFTNFSLSSFKLKFKLQILYSLQTTEMYLEPSWIFFMEFLCKNDKLFTVFMCLCVCVFMLFHLLVSSSCMTSVIYVRSLDQRSIVVSIFWVLLPSSFISISESILFHLQRRKLQPTAYWRENNMI